MSQLSFGILLVVLVVVQGYYHDGMRYLINISIVTCKGFCTKKNTSVVGNGF